MRFTVRSGYAVGHSAGSRYCRDMAEEISGAIERITFHNLDNGYCVLRVQAGGHREVVTVVGHAQQIVAGEYVIATGNWITDRTHGLQFKADEIKTTPPHTAEGIKKYLGSGLVKGIGPRFAGRIVEVFKEQTLDVIDQSPSFLSQVKGIGPKLIEKIRESWREQKTVRSIMVFLHSYGIGTARAVRIYKTYGENAIEMVKANPYRLSTDIWGVGFATADELALKLGIPRDSPFRAQAAVRHVLSEAATDGHVGYPEELLRERAVQITDIPPTGIADAIEQLRIMDEVVRDSVDEGGRGRGGRANSQAEARTAAPLPSIRLPPSPFRLRSPSSSSSPSSSPNSAWRVPSRLSRPGRIRCPRSTPRPPSSGPSGRWGLPSRAVSGLRFAKR